MTNISTIEKMPGLTIQYKNSQGLIKHFQGLTPVIDDFLGKSSKLAASLRSTVLALSSFLDR